MKTPALGRGVRIRWHLIALVCSGLSCALAASTAPVTVLVEPPVDLNLPGASSAPIYGATDLNGDGRPDVIGVLQGGAPAVWLNNGTSNPFQGVTGIPLVGAAANGVLYVYDINKDGHPDVVYFAASTPGVIYLNNGTANPFGGVTGIAIGGGTAVFPQNGGKADFGDIDGDGLPDLVINTASTTVPQRLYLSGGQSLSAGTQTPQDFIASNVAAAAGGVPRLADVNGDGRADLIFGYSSNEGGVELYLNNGTASPFAGVTPQQITSVPMDIADLVIGDMNGDGKPDIIVLGYVPAGRDSEGNALYGHYQQLIVNTGSATQPLGAPKSFPVAGHAWGGCYSGMVMDLNGDGRPDLVLVCNPYASQGDLDPFRIRSTGEIYMNDGSSEPFINSTPFDMDKRDTNGSTVVADLMGNHTLDMLSMDNSATHHVYFQLIPDIIPVAANDSFTVGTALSHTLDVLANDTGAGGTLNVTSIVITTQPAHGTLTNDGHALSYTSAAGYSGSDSFQYTVADNLGVISNVATVSLTVQSPPVASDDTATTTAGQSVSVDVLANDHSTGTLDASSVTIVTQPAHGTVQVGAGGAIVYQPAASYTGADTFQYSVKDNVGSPSNAAQVVVSIQAAPSVVSIQAAPSKGGGGAIDGLSLLMLGGATAAFGLRQRRAH